MTKSVRNVIVGVLVLVALSWLLMVVLFVLLGLGMGAGFAPDPASAAWGIVLMGLVAAIPSVLMLLAALWIGLRAKVESTP